MSLNIPERFLAARNDNQNKSFVISNPSERLRVNSVRDLSQIETLLDTGLRR